jgi:predicted nucleic acid-binding protein
LNKESGFDAVRDVMSEAQRSGESVLMNDINVGEVYYILHRRKDAESAAYFLDNILPALPVELVSNSFADVMRAAKIKAAHPLAYADCFAADTARRYQALLVTGDPEFKKTADIVDIEWLSR